VRVFTCVWSSFPTTSVGKAIPILFTTGFASDIGDGNSPSGKDFLRFLFRITGFFWLTINKIEQLLKLYVQVTLVMCSNSSNLSRSSNTLLVENSSSGLSMRILVMSVRTLKVLSGWLISSRLFMVIYSLSLLTSFSKKLIKVSSASLSRLSSFFIYAKTECDALFFANLRVCLITSLINCMISLIPSGFIFISDVFDESEC